MGFWIFMFLMNLLIPIMMIGFGKYFMKKSPKEINYIFGYRTTMSMKNADTWVFAHNYCGRIWYIAGWMILPVSMIVMLAVIGQSEDMIGTVGGFLCYFQFVPMIASIFLTEKALRKNFDKNGNRKLGFDGGVK